MEEEKKKRGEEFSGIDEEQKKVNVQRDFYHLYRLTQFVENRGSRISDEEIKRVQ